jgi:hypothetical protein
MTLAYFHGEGILFSSLIHLLFALLGGGLLLYGLAKYRSWAGAGVAAGFAAAALIATTLSQRVSSLLLETIVWGLTLPWNQIVPCYNLDSRCPLSPGVALICVVLNAAALYFLVAWVARMK